MNEVLRIDSAPARVSRVDAQGFLHVAATVTRAGVFQYLMPDGRVRRELRPFDEVFHDRNVESIKGSVVTNEHPLPLGTPVTAKNVKEHQVGHAGTEVKMHADHMVVDLVITDAATIEQIQAGKHEVSCGYRCRIDHESGIWQGPNGPEPYDVVQRGHVNNHIAVTRKGRGGPEVRLHLDSEDAVEFQPTTQESTRMLVKLTVDGVGVDLDASIAGVVKGGIESRDARIATLQAEVTKSAKELETLQAKYDQAEADLKDAKDKVAKSDTVDVQALVKARIAVMEKASKILPKEELSKLDDASDLDIVKACVKSKGVKIEEKSDDYVLARFDAIVESAGTATVRRSDSTFGQAVINGATVDERTDIQKRLDAAVARQDSAWRYDSRSTAVRKEEV